jgi:hypothetical protein
LFFPPFALRYRNGIFPDFIICSRTGVSVRVMPGECSGFFSGLCMDFSVGC